MNLVKLIDPLAPNAGETQGTDACDASGPIVSSLIHHPRIKAIIGEYVEQFPEIVDRLQDMVARGDFHSLRNLVHQLRGTGGGYGFNALSKFAGKVEDSILASDPPISIAARTHSLIDVIRRTDGYGRNITSDPTMKKAA